MDIGLAHSHKGWLKRAADSTSVKFPHFDFYEDDFIKNASGDTNHSSRNQQRVPSDIPERQQL